MRTLLRWSSSMTCVLWMVCGWAEREAQSAVIRVPQDHAGIQAAINAAQNGDVVLISPGTYAGGLSIAGKAITLASTFIDTGNPDHIAQTIVDGGAPILTIQANAGAATAIRGLTFRNGNYQLRNYAPDVSILNSRFIDGRGDQISFEGAGGLVRDCFLDNAGDDGIDADDGSDPTIERNTIQNAGNDGIEIRLHGYTGPLLQIVIRDNTITGSGEDGIQLIDYAGASSRTFRIEGNVLAGNGMAGLGCMAEGNTNENFAGAPLVEQVQVIGNTFSGNPHGLTGGDNMLVMNNIFIGPAQVGVKRVAASSLVTYNAFWANGTHHTGSNVVAGTTLFQDPMLDADYNLAAGSPCIDAGTGSIVWNGDTVSAPPYAGAAPDLGANETSGPPTAVSELLPGNDLVLSGVRPNPSRNGFAVSFALTDASHVRIEVLDLAGRRISSRDLVGLAPRSHVIDLPETRTLAAGAYVVRLHQGGRSRTTLALVVR